MKGRSPCICFNLFLSQTGLTHTPTQHAELHLILQGTAKHITDTAALAQAAPLYLLYMFNSKVFRKNQGSCSGCFRRRQEPRRPARCNPICHRQQDFWQRCDCCCQAKLQTHQWVNSPVFTAAIADNHFSAAGMTCSSLGSTRISQKSLQILLGLFSPFSSLGKQKK